MEQNDLFNKILHSTQLPADRLSTFNIQALSPKAKLPELLVGNTVMIVFGHFSTTSLLGFEVPPLGWQQQQHIECCRTHSLHELFHDPTLKRATWGILRTAMGKIANS